MRRLGSATCLGSRTIDTTRIAFLLFAACSGGGLLAGYLARRRHWLKESSSRALHLAVVLGIWAPLFTVSFWQLEIDRQIPVIAAIQLLLMLAGWGLARLAAWALAATRPQTGVMVLNGGLSNHGFTLGAFLAYVLLQPSAQALSYGVVYAVAMQVFMVLIFYPVARHYGPGEPLSLPRLLKQSFLDVRAAPLYAAMLGALLSLLEQPVPATLIRGSGLLSAMFFVGTAVTYGGIGLRLYLGDAARYWRHQLLMGAVKFVCIPALAFPLVSLARHTGLLTPLPAQVITIESFMPAAMHLVILANLFHLDARMASMLWLGNMVLFSLVPLPFLFWLSR